MGRSILAPSSSRSARIMRMQTKRGAKKVPWMLAAVLVAAGWSKTNAGESSTEKSAQPKLDELGDVAIEKRDEIERALQTQLDAARKALDELAAEAKQEGAESREKLVQELSQQEQAARTKLAELRASS